MMNCCEGLTVRAGDAARSDTQMRIDSIKIAWRLMFVVWRMISATVASSPARTEGIQNSHSFYSYSYSYYNAYSYDNGPA